MSITNLHAEFTRRLNTGDYSHKEAKVCGSCESPDDLPALRDLLLRTAMQMVGEAPLAPPAAAPSPAPGATISPPQPATSEASAPKRTAKKNPSEIVIPAGPAPHPEPAPSSASATSVQPVEAAPAYLPPTNGSAGPAVSATPYVPQPAETAAPAFDDVSDAEMAKVVGVQMGRIASLGGQYSDVRTIQAKYNGGDRAKTYTSVPREHRRQFLDELAAWQPAR